MSSIKGPAGEGGGGVGGWERSEGGGGKLFLAKKWRGGVGAGCGFLAQKGDILRCNLFRRQFINSYTLTQKSNYKCGCNKQKQLKVY